MKQKLTPYIYILFFFSFPSSLFSQNLTLKLDSKEIHERGVLKKITFKDNHIDSVSIYNEINKISNYLKTHGYFTSKIDNISITNKTYIAYFSLGLKIEKAILNISSESKYTPNYNKTSSNLLTIPIENLQSTLDEISSNLANDGKSFSKVKLSNISIKGTTLYANLNITPSKKRKIDKVIVSGYPNFSKSHIKHYFNLSDKSIFNNIKIEEISRTSKTLDFVKEVKPPEVLFKKDSTLLYIYLKKHQNNSFDGLVNFSSNNNGKVFFNGYINLKLSNIFHTGEKLDLFWNRIDEKVQEFTISSKVPYIFNSTFSPSISFNIYKQDSLFINTQFKSAIEYRLNTKSNIALTFNTETSNDIQSNSSTNNIESFSNYFLGFTYRLRIAKNDFFKNDKLYLQINPSFGNRKSDKNNFKQLKIEFNASYLWDINQRSSFYLKNETGYLNSDNFLNNELFRIGGINSIRGYNNQSLFTKSYSFFNLEYRYITSQKSYLYSITDFGRAKINNQSTNLLGLGLGYSFRFKNSQINLNSVTEKTNFKKAKITIQWKNFF